MLHPKNFEIGTSYWECQGGNFHAQCITKPEMVEADEHGEYWSWKAFEIENPENIVNYTWHTKWSSQYGPRLYEEPQYLTSDMLAKIREEALNG